MEYGLLSRAGRFLQKQTKRRRWTIMFLCMAAAVALGTFGFLKLYGEAMTHRVKILECGCEVHEHRPDCYDEDGEGNKALVCGMADYVIHTHNDDCYDQNGKLVCPLKEHKLHTHDKSCYKEERILICGMKEGEGGAEEAATDAVETAEALRETEIVRELSCEKKEHIHEDSCYEEGSGCGKEEHIHNDGCYKTVESLSCDKEEHIHDDSCYVEGEDGESLLSCDKKEHTHEEGCYVTETVPVCELTEHRHDDSCSGERKLICGQDEHQHDDGCYTDTVKETETAGPAGKPKDSEAQKAEGGAKSDTGHVHTDQCYETRQVLICELELHTHDVDPQSDACCYTPDCFDKNGDLIEGSRPSCGLLQLEEHVHTEECLKTVELTPEEVAALNNGAKLHIHEDSCYDEAGKLICGHNATHIHGLECYDEEGKLICGYGEQRTLTEEEQKEVEKVNQLIAGLPSEEEITRKMAAYEEAKEEEEEAFAEYMIALQVQIQEAYGAYLELDEALREYVTGADYLLTLWEMMGADLLDENPETVPDYAAFLPVGQQGEKPSGMVLELLYGDTKSHADKAPVGEEPNYTKDEMKGNFKLYTSNILGNTAIGDITLSLYFPQEYMDPKEISILEFPQDQVKHQISPVTEETREGKDYYKISITLKDYIPTGALTLPFDMKFKVAEVPADYELKIFGTLEFEEGDEKKESKPTAENIYRPKYEKPKITKYVNTNIYENMKEDYTRVSARVGENGVLESGQYVSFWYKLGDNHQLFRAYDTITLRDTLPTYKDSDGNMQYAVFDPAANPGWEIDLETDSQGHTVKRVFEVVPDWNPDQYDNKLMLEISQAELKLRFPGCKIDEESADGFLIKNLENHVGAVCDPVRPSEEETSDTCEDDIIFTLTSQPGAEGSFTKGNSADTVMDTYVTRSGSYRWSLAFGNKSSSNLVNVEVGDDVIDERLKFRSIVVKKEVWEKIDHVEAFTYDNAGDTKEATPEEPEKVKGDIYNPSDFAYTGKLEFYQATIYDTYTLTLNPEKEYKSFVIHFNADYQMAPGGKIEVWPFSTFRNPDVKHFVPGAENDLKNVYNNHAYVAYQAEGHTGPYDPYYFLKNENKFKLIENTESVWIKKEMYYGDNLKYPKKKANGKWDYNDGAYTFTQLYVEGSLDEDKDYDDLRIIDLLPDSLVVLQSATGELLFADAYGARYVKDQEIIENYHNSGRTAVIIYLNVDEVRKTLDAFKGDGSSSIYIGFKVGVKHDATPGTYINDAYLVSEDFDEPPTGHGQQPDSLNIQGKGTDAQIRWDQAGGSIQSVAGIYARKYIAKENSNAWSRDALRLKVGDSFQYKLSMMNFAGTAHQNLVVYDVLPRIGDRSVNNQADRGSEFTVNLRGPITPPEGYQVYYTDSQEVYQKDMASLVDANIWRQDTAGWSQENWNQITAFKFVANDGVEFGDAQIDFIVPVKVMDALTPESEAKLNGKEAQDRDTGTAVYLEATNSFGYSTNSYAGQNIESNYVKAQISFAGFVVRKTDENGTALSGAEFKLEKQLTPAGETSSEDGSTPDGDTGAQTQDGADQAPGWETIAERVSSDEKGKVSFKNLTVGTYRLTETKAPDGYRISTDPVTVTITFDDTTMEYTVAATGLSGSGTGRDPFIVVNETFYKLPETGGAGMTVYTLAGALLTMLGAGFMYKKKFRRRRG